MEEKRLEEWLGGCQLPPVNERKKEETRDLLQRQVSESRMTDAEFIWGQLGFIKPHTWIGQLGVFVVLCIVVYRLRPYYTDYRFYALFSTVTPLLLVCHIEELARVCYKSTLEIEMAAKYSLKKLLLSRLFILGIVDLLMFCLFAGFLIWQFEISILSILLYCLVPFQITVIGLLYLLKFAGRGLYGYQACAYTGLVCVCFVILSHYRPKIYSIDSQMYWVMAVLAAFVVLVWVAKDIWKKLDRLDDLILEN
ncbi:MAG: hypothetical protein K2L07_09230 [Lachnospiraceae bacterium]|nr:hypothetical protein [Lachnospiraceae bacterium]